MSVEDLKEYGRRCQAEPELKAKVQDIGMGLDHFDAHVAHAKSLGLQISMADMEALSAEAADNMELSDEALDAVAGGAHAVALMVEPPPVLVTEPPVILLVGDPKEVSDY